MKNKKGFHITTVFPGYHIKVVDPEVVYEGGSEGFVALASTKEFDIGDDQTQKVIMISEREKYEAIEDKLAGTKMPFDDALAHEIAHARLGHLDLEDSGDDLQDYIDDELEAWLFAGSERRRLGHSSIDTLFIRVIVDQVSANFPEASPKTIASRMSVATKKFTRRSLSRQDRRDIRDMVTESRR